MVEYEEREIFVKSYKSAHQQISNLHISLMHMRTASLIRH